MAARWQREGFSAWTVPETWVLVAPLYTVKAKLVLREGRWVSDDPAIFGGPWPASAFQEATAEILKTVEARR
jgi:hypothetical protein